MTQTPSTLVDLLHDRARRTPGQTAYTFLSDDGSATGVLNYADLDLKARSIAAHLQKGTQPGDRALLTYAPGLPFLSGLFGCFYAGVIAVPTHVPLHGRADLRFQSIVKDAEPVCVLTEQSLTVAIQTQMGANCVPRPPACFATDMINDHLAPEWRQPDISRQSLALLQYTSGSTGAPKGVMVTHGNLLSNQVMMSECFGTSPASVMVGWLPHFHDMGLIAHLLHAAYVGCHCVFISPMTFAQRSDRWLRAIMRYGGTISGAPNFAYALCAKRATPKLLEELDLSSWDVAFNGSEPLHAETLTQFTETFAPCGLRVDTFHPVYGLAEATVFVSGAVAQEKARELTVDGKALEQHHVVLSPPSASAARRLVGSGRSWGEQHISIVDPETQEKSPADSVGEIWVSGPHVAQGYWQKPDASIETFGATLRTNTEDCQHPWLRTGDLGFLHDGELYVTGRLKDLIIIRGRNHYPQDIESLMARLQPRLRPHGTAAFAIDVDYEERLVVVHEVAPGFDVNGDANKLIQAFQRDLSEQFQLRAWAVALVPRKTIPITTSGKVQRQACRRLFIDQLLPCLLLYHDDAPDTAGNGTVSAPEDRSQAGLQRWLQALVSRELGLDAVSPNESMFNLGFDSLQLVKLLFAVESGLETSVRVAAFTRKPTIAHLAILLSDSQISNETGFTSPPISPLPNRVAKPIRWQRLRHRLIESGPFWLGAALPYEAGSRMLYRFVRSRVVQKRIYHTELALLKGCIAAVPQQEPVDRVIMHSLLSNSWAAWRADALSSSESFKRWVTIDGSEFVQDTLRAGQGIVLAFAHTRLKKLLWSIPMLQNQELAVIGNMGPANLRRSGLTHLANLEERENGPPSHDNRLAQVFHAQEVLRRGGVAVIFPDDVEGQGGISVDFHGRLRPLRPGMAELALRTDARIVPVFASLHTSGRVRFEFLPPLDVENGSFAQKTEKLLRQYADLLTTRWTTDLGQFEWYILREFLQLPPCRSSQVVSASYRRAS